MRLQGELLEGSYKSRPNRFTCLVDIEGSEVRCYLPNPGRLKELLEPYSTVVLRRIYKQRRKTSHDLIGIFHRGIYVSVDSRLPNRVFSELFDERTLEEFARYDRAVKEYRYGKSRIDFLLKRGEEKCLLEIKSCTLVKKGVALFPDAPTKRGTRHLHELMSALKKGYRAAVLFMVQREDASMFSPNTEMDRTFSEALTDAHRRGVQVLAYSMEFKDRVIRIKNKLPVAL